MRVSALLRGAAVLGAAAAFVPMWGCGGSSGAASSRMATATFNIKWPSSATRVIPAETERFVIYVNGDGMTTQAFIVDKPSGSANTSYQYRVPVPAGAKRIFSAEAQKDLGSGDARYPNLTQVAVTSADLTRGDRIAAGIDPNPYDIAPGANVTAEVELQVPATPSGGVTDVTGTIQQILSPSFPSVGVLEIFRDQDGNPISDINAANLTVKEDGVPAVITDVRTVSQSGQPLSVAMVLDRSGSMGSQGNSDLETAASTFVNLMGVDDAGEVVNFSSSVQVSQTFTTDKSLLLAAIQGRSAGGSTALWDAVGQAIVDTGARTGRRAVIAMTDGYNNASSTYTKASVIDAANAAGVPIFTIGMGSSVDPGLGDVGVQTGGINMNAPTSGQLNDVYQRISGQLSGQMQISFISPNPFSQSPPVTRTVEVTLNYGGFVKTATFTYSM